MSSTSDRPVMSGLCRNAVVARRVRCGRTSGSLDASRWSGSDGVLGSGGGYRRVGRRWVVACRIRVGLFVCRRSILWRVPGCVHRGVVSADWRGRGAGVAAWLVFSVVGVRPLGVTVGGVVAAGVVTVIAVVYALPVATPRPHMDTYAVVPLWLFPILFAGWFVLVAVVVSMRTTWLGPALPPVRITLPDGTIVTSDQADLHERLACALGREVRLEAAERGRPEAAESSLRHRFRPARGHVLRLRRPAHADQRGGVWG